MDKRKILTALSLWIALSVTPAWAAGPDEAHPGGDPLQGPSAHPYPFFLSEEPDASPVYINLMGLRLAPLRTSALPDPDEKDAAIQGLKARYDMNLGHYSFELSGGYLPGMKSLAPSEARLDPKASLGYLNLKIPLDSFYVKGGAFFGQNMEILGLVLRQPFEDRSAQRELFGYQFGGGYRLNESLIVQAGWGQATQEYEKVKEGLKAWYLQAQISLGWRMSVTPQVGYLDFTKSDGENMRVEAFYCGARWQINF